MSIHKARLEYWQYIKLIRYLFQTKTFITAKYIFLKSTTHSLIQNGTIQLNAIQYNIILFFIECVDMADTAEYRGVIYLLLWL